jgi:AcrR family transcriptional regulator
MNLSPRQIQRRERILRTVRSHLSRGGYENLSMREVASASSVSPTTLYNLYENKDGLVLAALQDQLAQVARDFDEALNGIEKLIDRAAVSSRHIVETPRYAEAMMRMLFNSESTDPIAEVLLHSSIATNRQLIIEMQELGEARKDIDVEPYARNLAASRWANLFLWTQGHIALRNLEREYVRTELLTLVPAMTPRTLKKYRPMVDAD